MPPRLLLDGEDLRSLMLRVREEMGPDARIVKAERIRSGGFAGFFAKERYELTVEVPEPETRRRRPVRRPAPATAPAAGIDALLAAAEAAEDEDAGLTGPEADGVPAAAATAPAPTEPAPEPTGPQVSTSGETFAEVLQSMRQIVGPLADVEVVDTQVLTPPAGIEGPEPAPGGPARPDPTGQPDAEGTPAPPDASVDASGGPGDDAAADPGAADPGAPEPSGSSVTALLELGIPARLMTGVGDLTAPMPLSVLVRRFDRPPALVTEPCAVVVVVGTPDLALRTATQMANRTGLPPQDIVLAGEMPQVPGHGRRLQTVAAAGRFRSRVAQDVPTVVALGVGEEPEEREHAAELLEALEPDQAWAAVDATARAVELRRWLRAVGARRPVDVLAALGTFDAQAPGTVLSLGLPVGWVDGLPANPVVWAAVLSERLADDARWD